MRPANHTATRTRSGIPDTGFVPVQFGTAVSMKPETAAAVYPNSISCPCHRWAATEMVGDTMTAFMLCIASHAIHAAIARTA